MAEQIPDTEKKQRIIFQVVGLAILVGLSLFKLGLDPPVDGAAQKQSPGTAESTDAPLPEDELDPESFRKKLPLGHLTQVRREVFRSAAGLNYRAGSEDGHRLDHVLKHGHDAPDKKTHGVFDGDRETILAVIDEAYVLAQKGSPDVQSETQSDRRILTVNLKRRIGYVGGESGKRDSFPECHFLRIVVENGNDIVTAYPTKSY